MESLSELAFIDMLNDMDTVFVIDLEPVVSNRIMTALHRTSLRLED